MHHYSQLEALAADRIRSWFAEAEESRLAHRARADSKAVRTTGGEAGSKKLRLPLPRLSATRSACDTPDVRLQRRAS
jgi:hypothetical protein